MWATVSATGLPTSLLPPMPWTRQVRIRLSVSKHVKRHKLLCSYVFCQISRMYIMYHCIDVRFIVAGCCKRLLQSPDFPLLHLLPYSSPDQTRCDPRIRGLCRPRTKPPTSSSVLSMSRLTDVHRARSACSSPAPGQGKPPGRKELI